MREHSERRGIEAITESTRKELSRHFLMMHRQGLFTAPIRFDEVLPEVFFGTFREQMQEHGLGGIITAVYPDARSQPLICADLQHGTQAGHALLEALDDMGQLIRVLLHEQRIYWEMTLDHQSADLPAQRMALTHTMHTHVLNALHDQTIDTSTEEGQEYLMDTYALTSEQYKDAVRIYRDGEEALAAFIKQMSGEIFDMHVATSAGIADTRYILQRIAALEQYATHAPESLGVVLAPLQNATFLYTIYHKNAAQSEQTVQ